MCSAMTSPLTRQHEVIPLSDLRWSAPWDKIHPQGRGILGEEAEVKTTKNISDVAVPCCSDNICTWAQTISLIYRYLWKRSTLSQFRKAIQMLLCIISYYIFKSIKSLIQTFWLCSKQQAMAIPCQTNTSYMSYKHSKQEGTRKQKNMF